LLIRVMLSSIVKGSEVVGLGYGKSRRRARGGEYIVELMSLME
jgi:hypothetical protein